MELEVMIGAAESRIMKPHTPFAHTTLWLKLPLLLGSETVTPPLSEKKGGGGGARGERMVNQRRESLG